jgi:hypothetical protein
VLVEVADFMQDEVIENLHRPWPVCRVHDKGGCAQLVDRQPVWFCRFRKPHDRGDRAAVPLTISCERSSAAAR